MFCKYWEVTLTARQRHAVGGCQDNPCKRPFRLILGDGRRIFKYGTEQTQGLL